MTAKILVSVLILFGIAIGMFFGLDVFSQRMEKCTDLAGDIIEAGSVSYGIESLYAFEDYFLENRLIFSMFLHDSELEDIESLIVDVRSSFFSGDGDDAIAFASLLRERLIQLRRSIEPSFENIM